MLGHREKHTEKETWHLYKSVFLLKKNKQYKWCFNSGDSLSTSFGMAVVLETLTPRRRCCPLSISIWCFSIWNGLSRICTSAQNKTMRNSPLKGGARQWNDRRELHPCGSKRARCLRQDRYHVAQVVTCQDKVDLRLTKILTCSCISNTKTIWNEDETVDVRAVLPIKRGTEITKNYVNRWQYSFGKLLPPVSLLLGW